MYWIFVLKSVKYNKYYVGQTNDLNKRLSEHNNGKSTYTKKYVPWFIIYEEKVLDRNTAVRREKYFKSTAGRRWLKKYAQVAKLVDALP